MKKFIMVFCLLGCLAMDLPAQNRIVVSGLDASGSGGGVSCSVGLIDYTTKSGTGGIITDGVQQPYEIFIITGIKEVGINLEAVVFPNPTTDFVELRLDLPSNESLKYELIDINGKSIERNRIKENTTRINVASLSKGIYLLNVSSSGKVIKVFQIIKH